MAPNLPSEGENRVEEIVERGKSGKRMMIVHFKSEIDSFLKNGYLHLHASWYHKKPIYLPILLFRMPEVTMRIDVVPHLLFHFLGLWKSPLYRSAKN